MVTVYFKGASAILQNTISTKIGIIEHWLATVLKILMKPLILAKILFAKIHLSSNDYATYYSWLPDKSNPGMLRMLTKEQLEQKNISSELVCRIRFTLVCIILNSKYFCVSASTSRNIGQRCIPNHHLWYCHCENRHRRIWMQGSNTSKAFLLVVRAFEIFWNNF